MNKIKFKELWDKDWLQENIKTKCVRKISKFLGCSHGATNNAIRKLNIVNPRKIMESKVKRGRFASNWKGGRPDCLDCGKHLVRLNAKRCRSCARRFQYKNNPASHPQYIDGRTPLYISLRSLKEHKDWSLRVLKRDNFTCILCGSSKGGNLEADHIKPFCELLDDFLEKYNKYSPIFDKSCLCKLAIRYEPFWEVSNGRCLCKDCHKKTITYGARKNSKKFKFKSKKGKV